MSTYAIGDIQGCFRTLEGLLERVGFDPARDRLWLVGDLVNRGPRSLEVLRWAVGLGDRLVAVLGNHDLHLLATAAGDRKPRRLDTLEAVLAAPDREALIDWLRRRPLLHREGDTVLVHAGLARDWTVEEAAAQAAAASTALSAPDWQAFLGRYYGGRPQDAVEAALYEAIRTLTTVRAIREADGALVSSFSGPPAERPAGTVPWFEAPGRRSAEAQVVFGHWAALGLHRAPNVVALDSGCVWGGPLTAWRLEDGAIFQEPRRD